MSPSRVVTGRAGAVLALMLAACGPGESRITNPRLQADTQPPAEAVPPLALQAASLVATNHSDAGPRDWVVCTAGALGSVKACPDQPRAWLDPARDEVTLEIHAQNATMARARAASTVVEARFVAGRAKLVVPLREAYRQLSAARLTDEAALTVALEVEPADGSPTTRGELSLHTPRALKLLEDGALPPDPNAQGTAFIGPEPERLPPTEDRPIATFRRHVVDVGTPHLALPCDPREPTLRAQRLVRPLVLRVFDKGQLTQTHTLDDDRCGPPPGPAEVLDALTQDAPTPPRPALDLAAQPATAEALDALSRLIGLGAPAEPAPGLHLQDGVLIELERTAALTPLRIKHLDSPLLALHGGTAQTALDALGRPNFMGRGFLIWTAEAGPTTTYLELRCGPPDRFIEPDAACTSLRVGVITGKDPHDGGDVPGATPNPHSHRHPNDHPDHDETP